MGLSQREVGLLMGLPANVAAPRINQYERGSAEPSVDDLARLADALGLPAAALVTKDAALLRMLRAWSDAPAKDRIQVTRELEARAREAGHPGSRATSERIERAREGWSEQRRAVRKAVPKAKAAAKKGAASTAGARRPGGRVAKKAV
ncbi:transcriptional regulator with XRE-family HTH domain [Lysobacter sp. HA18]